MSRDWEPGTAVLVTGAMGGQMQRAVIVGPDPNDKGRILVCYTAPTFGEIKTRSVHAGRLRDVPVLPDTAAQALAQGMTGLA